MIPYLFAGPRIDVLIARNAEGMEAVFDNLKETGVGASIGAGVEVPLIFLPCLLAEFRYSPSFDYAFSSEHLTVKNQSFEIIIGTRF